MMDLSAIKARCEAAQEHSEDKSLCYDYVTLFAAQDIPDLIKEIERLREVLDSPELMEVLADIEHERWSGWERHRESVVCLDKEIHWRGLRDTPYAELPEHSKESDRKEVRKTLAAIRQAMKGNQ